MAAFLHRVFSTGGPRSQADGVRSRILRPAPEPLNLLTKGGSEVNAVRFGQGRKGPQAAVEPGGRVRIQVDEDNTIATEPTEPAARPAELFMANVYSQTSKYLDHGLKLGSMVHGSRHAFKDYDFTSRYPNLVRWYDSMERPSTAS